MCKRIILNLRLLSVDDLIKAALFCYKPLCWPSFKSQFDKCVASAADRRLFAVSQPFLLLDICPHKWYSLENCTHCKRLSKKDMKFFYTLADVGCPKSRRQELHFGNEIALVFLANSIDPVSKCYVHFSISFIHFFYKASLFVPLD